MKKKDRRTISWFSCGAASAVATKLALLEGPVTIVYCKVMEEHPDNERFLLDCQRWFGQEIEVLMDETYSGSIYKVFEKQYMKTPHGSPCTRILKKRVRERFEQPNDRQVFGYTLEEQDRVDRFIDANNDVDIWPILIERNLTKNNCLAMLESADIELPEMYKLGYRNNNCVGCVKGGMGYWNKIRVDFPEAFKRMADFERRKGYTVLKEPKTGAPLYLHDLDPNRGNYPKEILSDCGIFCHLSEMEIKWQEEGKK